MKLVGASGEAGVTLNDAVGAWSGVKAMPRAVEATVMAVPAVFVATVIGMTVPEPWLDTYAVWPFGVMRDAPGVIADGDGAACGVGDEI